MRVRIAILLIIVIAGIALLYLYKINERNHPSNILTLFGNVDIRQVDLGFRVSGRVTELFFEEGDLIPAGTLVARLDIQPYKDQVHQAQANIQAAKVNLDNAEKVYERRKNLFEAKDGSVSVEDYENSLASRDTAEASLEQAKAALGVSQTSLNDTEAYAPNEGIVLTRIREPGTVVKAGDPVYTLSLTNPIWIRAFVPEPYLGVIYPGMNADIITDVKGGPIYKGKIGFISPVAEFTPKTVETTNLRTDLVYRLRIYTDDPERKLRQGMPVTVRINLDQQPEGKPESGVRP